MYFKDAPYRKALSLCYALSSVWSAQIGEIPITLSIYSLFDIKGGHPDCQYKAVFVVFFFLMGKI